MDDLKENRIVKWGMSIVLLVVVGFMVLVPEFECEVIMPGVLIYDSNETATLSTRNIATVLRDTAAVLTVSNRRDTDGGAILYTNYNRQNLAIGDSLIIYSDRNLIQKTLVVEKIDIDNSLNVYKIYAQFVNQVPAKNERSKSCPIKIVKRGFRPFQSIFQFYH